jgi:oxygen-independent coproporphyrinogen-3 oxidase
MLEAVKHEIIAWHKKMPSRKLTSIFFGGGTPSLMSQAQIDEVINLCEKLWGFEDEIEITLETNPDDANFDKLSGFRAAGINRLSLGVQSYFDSGLKELGRFHSAEESVRATENARKIFDNLSIDIIYARPNQSLEEMRQDFIIAHSLGIDHISPYQLTIEPDTAFARKAARGAIIPKPDDEAGDFYNAAGKILGELGFQQYEISNHATSPDKYSKHNLLYWQSQDFIGIGAGAHGRLGDTHARFATHNFLKPDEYINAVRNSGLATVEYEQLTVYDAVREYYLMGLRLNDGCALLKNDRVLNHDKLNTMIDDGYITRIGNIISISDNGRKFANYIVSQILD